jgi:hypothetical protein
MLKFLTANYFQLFVTGLTRSSEGALNCLLFRLHVIRGHPKSELSKQTAKFRRKGDDTFYL